MTVFLRKNNQKPRHNRHKLSLLQRLLVQGERFEAPLQFLLGTDYTDKHGKRINLIHVIRIIRALAMSASKLNFFFDTLSSERSSFLYKDYRALTIIPPPNNKPSL